MKAWFKMLGWFFLIFLVIGGYWGYKTYTFVTKMQAQEKPKQVVSTIEAKRSGWQGKITAVATVRAVKDIYVTSEVAGIIDKVLVDSSDEVEEGKTLFTISAAEDKARLVSLQAQSKLSAANYARDKEQFAAGAISQVKMDASSAEKAVRRAAVVEHMARLNKKTIKAPYSGVLGILQVDEGEWVKSGAQLVSLQTLDPIWAEFTLPQNVAGKVQLGDQIRFITDAYPDDTFTGKVSIIDKKIDPITRTILVRAEIINSKRRLLPGYYGKVELDEGKQEKLITLPQTAVVYSPYGESIYMVSTAKTFYENAVAKAKKNGADKKALESIEKPKDPDQKVALQVYVKTGARRGDQIAVLSGIEEGFEIVTSGQIKLKNGSLIEVNNQNPPSNDAEPKINQPL